MLDRLVVRLDWVIATGGGELWTTASAIVRNSFGTGGGSLNARCRCVLRGRVDGSGESPLGKVEPERQRIGLLVMSVGHLGRWKRTEFVD